MFVYCVFPYDLAAAREWAPDWVIQRYWVNLGVTLGYYTFWEANTPPTQPLAHVTTTTAA